MNHTHCTIDACPPCSNGCCCAVTIRWRSQSRHSLLATTTRCEPRLATPTLCNKKKIHTIKKSTHSNGKHLVCFNNLTKLTNHPDSNQKCIAHTNTHTAGPQPRVDTTRQEHHRNSSRTQHSHGFGTQTAARQPYSLSIHLSLLL